MYLCKITNYVTEVPIEELEQGIDTLAVSKFEQDTVLNKVYRDEVNKIRKADSMNWTLYKVKWQQGKGTLSFYS